MVVFTADRHSAQYPGYYSTQFSEVVPAVLSRSAAELITWVSMHEFKRQNRVTNANSPDISSNSTMRQPARVHAGTWMPARTPGGFVVSGLHTIYQTDWQPHQLKLQRRQYGGQRSIIASLITQRNRREL
jgi:hypothetical protein